MELLKFYADWCGPCKAQSQILDGYDAVPIRELDIEEEVEMANKYNVRSIPTLILREDEQVYASFSGLTELSEIKQAVEQHS